MADAWEKLRYDKEAGREGTKATELASHQQIPTEYKLFIEGRAAEVNKRWKTALDTYQFLRHLYPRGIVYGLRLASVQIANSDGGGALRTLGDLRQLPHPFGDDPRIDITEAEAHESLGSHEQAITAARQAIAGAKQRSAGLLEANANLTLCWASRSLGRYEDAFLACDAAQRDFKKFHDNVSAAVARNRMAALAVDQGDFKAATEAYDDVVQTTRDADAKQDQAGALVNAAGVMIRQRAPDKARSYLQESLQISVPIDDKYDQALAHILLADISAGEGRYTDAKAEVTIAHTLAKTIDDRSTQAYALSNLGQYQSELGELDNALLSFQSALDLRTALHEQPGIAACHSNMGDISYHRGDLDAAEQHYRDALEQYSNLDEQGPNVARLRLSLATIALERGNRKDAISSAERAIAQFRRQNDKDAESEAASVLVRAFVGEGQTQQASPYFARIQEIDSEDVDVRLEGAIARAEFLAASKQHLEAKRILQSAIEQASSTQEKFALMQARLTLLRLERDDNNHPAHWRGELTRIRREAAKAGFGLITRSADSL